jgi:hypothetical protein
VGKLYTELDEGLCAFIRRQRIFFVGSAPLSAAGHVNVSPKGLDTFRILGPRTVGYLDLTGSGIETVAHLHESGRLTLLFCAFDGPPRLLRLYGRGRVVEPEDVDWDRWTREFPEHVGARAVILLELDRIADSCGYGVPLFEFRGERTQLKDYAEKKGVKGLHCYRAEKNRASIDGLPGLRRTPGE